MPKFACMCMIFAEYSKIFASKFAVLREFLNCTNEINIEDRTLCMSMGE